MISSTACKLFLSSQKTAVIAADLLVKIANSIVRASLLFRAVWSKTNMRRSLLHIHLELFWWYIFHPHHQIKFHLNRSPLNHYYLVIGPQVEHISGNYIFFGYKNLGVYFEMMTKFYFVCLIKSRKWAPLEL